MGVVRFIMIGIGAALLLLAVAAILLFTRMQPFVRDQVAGVLGTAFGGKVTFEGVEISLAQRGVRVTGIEIRNPEGFDDAPAIVCPALVLRPDWRSVFAEKTVFDEIHIENLNATLRYELGKGTNLAALTGNLQTYLEKHPFRRPFLVRKLVFAKPTVEITAALLPAGVAVSADSFEVKDFSNTDKDAMVRLAAGFAGALHPSGVALSGPAAQAFDLFKKELGG